MRPGCVMCTVQRVYSSVLAGPCLARFPSLQKSNKSPPISPTVCTDLGNLLVNFMYLFYRLLYCIVYLQELQAISTCLVNVFHKSAIFVVRAGHRKNWNSNLSRNWNSTAGNLNQIPTLLLSLLSRSSNPFGLVLQLSPTWVCVILGQLQPYLQLLRRLWRLKLKRPYVCLGDTTE